MTIEPDVLLVDDFLSEHAKLFDALRECVDWDTRMASRHTASYGVPYNYSQMQYPERPMLDSLVPVAERLWDRLGFRMNNCLLNFYLTGQSTMGFHSDDTTDLQSGTGVAIVSLGSPRGITFRDKSNPEIQHTFSLKPGSLLYMDAKIQTQWVHAIRKQKDAGPRISLTWRAFKISQGFVE